MYFQLIASLLWLLGAIGLMLTGPDPFPSGADRIIKESRRASISGLPLPRHEKNRFHHINFHRASGFYAQSHPAPGALPAAPVDDFGDFCEAPRHGQANCAVAAEKTAQTGCLHR